MSNATELPRQTDEKAPDEQTDVIEQITRRAASDIIDRIDDLDYDIEKIDQWDVMEAGSYTVGTVKPQAISASMLTAHTRMRLDPTNIEATSHVIIAYDPEGISLEIGAGGDETEAAALAEVSPDAAREIACALLLAAAEFERRPREDDRESDR